MSGSTGNNVIGSGSDSITLNMAEDQALGVDAKFSVNVDGQQIGGEQTVTSSQSSGQTEQFTFLGNYAPGQHAVTVSFANNFIYPGLSGDRNLYVDGVSYDGQSVSTGTTPIYETAFFPPNSTVGNVYGNATFSVNDTTPVPSGAPSEPTTTPGAVSIGSGADTLVLNMAEDPYQGDAQFTVAVDGKQIGGTQTTTAIVDQGQAQEFDVHGDFGGGSHNVTVTFLNDLIGDFYPSGTPGLPSGQWAVDTTDRNLYVMGMSMNGGSPASGAPWELSSNGSASFSVNSGSNPSATALNSGLFGPNGAAAGSGNAAITSNSLAISSSPSFATASDTSATAASDTSSSTSTPASTSSTSGSSDTSATTGTTVDSTTPTVQDVTTPVQSSTSYSTDTSSSTNGSSGAWWSGYHDHGYFHGTGSSQA